MFFYEWYGIALLAAVSDADDGNIMQGIRNSKAIKEANVKGTDF